MPREPEYNYTLNAEDVYEAPALITSQHQFMKMWSRIKLFEMVYNLHGNIAELGVYKGQGLLSLYHCLNLFQPQIFGRRLYGFDTFEGFASITDNDTTGGRKNKIGDLNAKIDIIEDALKAHDYARGNQEHNKRVILIKGDACETIPAFMEAHPDRLFSLVIIDFDLYAPTKVALDYFIPKVVEGGIIAIDDVYSDVYPGVRKALKEYLDVHPCTLHDLNPDSWLTYFKKKSQ